jgi:2-(1,2-epoxy-1,2-dihydrophenyl)acetyl-CoA isomerase
MLEISLENGIKTIAFNIPQKKNPLLPESTRQLKAALDESLTDGTKVVIITGNGGNFSSGAMLDPNLLSKGFDVTEYLRNDVNTAIMAIRELPIPVIAKVQGVCVGLGFSIALACDMLYASENAMFSQIFTRIGLSSDGGGAYFLAQTVGYRKAFELIANNANISAAQALEWGIANAVFEDSAFEASVLEFAQNLAAGPTVALAQVKQNLQVALKGDLAEALDTEAINQGKCFKSSDFIEGVMAFMQKRKPKFKGK